MRTAPFLLCLALFVSLLPGRALAEEAAQESGEPVPFAEDTLGGHVQLGLSGTYAAPFGHIAKSVKSTARSGDGWGLQADLGVGLDRFVAVGAYGEYQRLGASGRCPDCSATSWGAGAFVAYHFVQGLRFDPFISYGIGYRKLSSSFDGEERDYGGLEWLRLQFGGNWFLAPAVALGPFVEFGGGTMIDRPRGEHLQGSYWRFQLGLRLTLDIPGH